MVDSLPAEFSLIVRHFRPLAGPGALELRDDAAELVPPAGRHLVLTADAMVAGVHFLPDDPPDLIGQKLLRVNLSDLAAKGAVPLGYLMTVSCPRGARREPVFLHDGHRNLFLRLLADLPQRFGVVEIRHLHAKLRRLGPYLLVLCGSGAGPA